MKVILIIIVMSSNNNHVAVKTIDYYDGMTRCEIAAEKVRDELWNKGSLKQGYFRGTAFCIKG